jgi:hypothetical protein
MFILNISELIVRNLHKNELKEDNNFTTYSEAKNGRVPYRNSFSL